ncbi:hypothetical protein H5410_037702 [Solanum commersonii]|uniref:Uncharacterized protein n=1 Tax=Solanum commersonii TaxID=4109 RepID=A0A9J5YBX0_SOLCO|nr:hypothetical protein H5410_037702 [Solanum commersonii]
MLLFPVPAFVAKKIDKVLRDFLCQIYSFKGKKDGGLGVRGLKMHNVILLTNGYGGSQMRKLLCGKFYQN